MESKRNHVKFASRKIITKVINAQTEKDQQALLTTPKQKVASITLTLRENPQLNSTHQIQKGLHYRQCKQRKKRKKKLQPYGHLKDYEINNQSEYNHHAARPLCLEMQFILY